MVASYPASDAASRRKLVGASENLALHADGFAERRSGSG
jgi:hypothetical protein